MADFGMYDDVRYTDGLFGNWSGYNIRCNTWSGVDIIGFIRQEEIITTINNGDVLRKYDNDAARKVGLDDYDTEDAETAFRIMRGEINVPMIGRPPSLIWPINGLADRLVIMPKYEIVIVDDQQYVYVDVDLDDYVAQDSLAKVVAYHEAIGRSPPKLPKWRLNGFLGDFLAAHADDMQLYEWEILHGIPLAFVAGHWRNLHCTYP